MAHNLFNLSFLFFSSEARIPEKQIPDLTVFYEIPMSAKNIYF